MPYGRRRRGVKSIRRRRFGRSRRRAGRRSWLSTGISLAKQVWKLKGLVNSEMYKLDSSVTAQSLPDTGYVAHLTGVAQGDGDGQRTGNSIFVRSYNLKGFLYRTTSGDQAQMVRIAVIMDTQQIADSMPSITDIYEASTPFSHLNSNTVGRYKVLWSQVYTMDVVKSLSAKVEINIPMRHHVRYNGSASTDIQRGGLFLVVVSSQGTANYPTFSFEQRLSYHDN